jgi:iron complex transport system permease protein
MLAGAAGLIVDVGAATGAFGAMLLVFAVAHGAGGWTTTRLLLTGVVVAAGCGAIVSLLLSLSDDLRLRGMLFWLLGDFSYVQTPWWLLALALAAIPTCLLAARPLDALARGELQATLLGVPVRGLRIAIYVAASVLTAAAVTTAGSIGFVGLVTPHLVRLLVGSSHRAVIPAAALAGGALLVVADLLARTIVAPRQLPVGALTAMIGVPLFLLLMRRQSVV